MQNWLCYRTAVSDLANFDFFSENNIIFCYLKNNFLKNILLFKKTGICVLEHSIKNTHTKLQVKIFENEGFMTFLFRKTAIISDDVSIFPFPPISILNTMLYSDFSCSWQKTDPLTCITAPSCDFCLPCEPVLTWPMTSKGVLGTLKSWKHFLRLIFAFRSKNWPIVLHCNINLKT